MLVCPQCQFENPNAHKYCQKCGSSLTHHPCPDCGHLVALSELHCPECDAIAGKVLHAVLAIPPSPASSEAGSETGSERAVCPVPFYGDFLDLGRRYRPVGGSAEDNFGFQAWPVASDWQGFGGSAIDCQPLQKSVLAVLLEQQSALMGESRDASDAADGRFWQQLGIPSLARPYLRLQEFNPTLPSIYDAWQEGDWEVILLGDRSHWQCLSDVLGQDSLSLLQVVYWLNELVTLWKALEPLGCGQSLLVKSNLRIDEDQTFGLCQLYPNPSLEPLTLAQLALFWKEDLLSPASPYRSAELDTLLDRVISGEIASLADVRMQLQDLADRLQHPDPETVAEPGWIESSALTFSIDEMTSPGDGDSSSFASGPQDPLITLSEGDDLSTAVLPIELLSLTEAGQTDRGMQRPHNEDYFGIYSHVQVEQSNQSRKVRGHGLYLVCDGMGGHAAGEVASAMAAEVLRDAFAGLWQGELPNAEAIKEGIWQANQQLYQVNQKNASMGSGRMGTTLVMLIVQDTKAAIAHVGDSRVYRVSRKWGLEQLTVDHEVGQKAIQSGLDPILAYSRPDAYQLTQALGPHDNDYVQPDVHFLDVQEDTLFLLCSDGMSDNELIEDNWKELLLPLLSSNASLEKGVNKLIAFANQHNGHDNITGILVRLKVRPYLAI